MIIVFNRLNVKIREVEESILKILNAKAQAQAYIHVGAV